MTTNLEPHECWICLQFTKIGTHENKAIHSNYYILAIYVSMQLQPYL